MTTEFYLRAIVPPLTYRMVRDYLWVPFDGTLCLSRNERIQRRFAEVVTPERVRRGTDAAPVIRAAPAVWAGYLSWARASWSWQGENHVPAHVAIFYDLCLRVPLIDDAFLARARAGLALPDQSMYAQDYLPARLDAILPFLEAHRGQRVFTTSQPVARGKRDDHAPADDGATTNH